MDLLSRKEAFAQGLTRFYTGRPCKHGHDCERYTSTKGCVECVNTSWKIPKISRVSSAPLSSLRACQFMVEVPLGASADDRADFVKWVQYQCAPVFFKERGFEYGPSKSKVEGA